jgi:hypothetical protein
MSADALHLKHTGQQHTPPWSAIAELDITLSFPLTLQLFYLLLSPSHRTPFCSLAMTVMPKKRSPAWPMVLFVLLCLPTLSLCQVGLNPNVLASFETPALAALSWAYAYQAPLAGLLSAAQPWTFCYTCGIATNNSLWSAATPPPDGAQFAFMQTPPGNRTATISATLLGLSASTYYYLSFWYAIRAYQGENVNSGEELFVSIDGMQVFSTNYINDPQGWIQQNSALFTTQASTPTSAQLLITVLKATSVNITTDYSVLIDAVSVATNTQQTLAAASSQLSAVYSFETPAVGSASWSYSFSSPLASSYPTSQVPFLFVGLGGIAASGSPWDPPGAAAPPAGTQYVYLQMAPDNVYSTQSSIITTLTGLSSGTQYAVTFYYAMRNNNVTVGQPSNDMVAVVVNGQTIWSIANVLVQNGWTYAAAPFTATASSHTVQFIITESIYSDHAWLLDAISFVPASQPPSSSTGSAQIPSSSTASAGSSGTSAASSSSSSLSKGAIAGIVIGCVVGAVLLLVLLRVLFLMVGGRKHSKMKEANMSSASEAGGTTDDEVEMSHVN